MKGMARNHLPLDSYDAKKVLMPGPGGTGRVEAVRVTIFASYFPQRAIAPELIVGDVSAERVSISADQKRLEGYLRHLPRAPAVIRVRYGDSLEGELRERFSPERIRPLPDHCGDER
jgi:hypothetical protein